MKNRDFERAFGKHLRELMRERGLTPRMLSETTGISQPVIRAYMNGLYIPGPENTDRLLYGLNCEEEDLYDFENERNVYNNDWKPSNRYPDYELNPEGKIRNAKTGRILKTHIDKKGYEIVSLRKDNRPHSERVHKLMADTFMEDVPDGYDIYHENLNRADNRLENLKYCTKSETCKRAFREGNRKGRGKIRVRIVETDEEFNSIRECAYHLGVAETVISRCVNGLIKSCKGYTITRIDD